MKTPGAFAVEAGREYITPEDVQNSIDSGVDALTLFRNVLKFVEAKACEDERLCAYVALAMERTK